MNALTKSSLFFGLLLALGTTSVRAGDDAPAAGPSRAEVLAELEIWRESGLPATECGDAADPTNPAHVEALARYHALRAAPRFAQIVDRIERARGEKRQVAAQR